MHSRYRTAVSSIVPRYSLILLFVKNFLQNESNLTGGVITEKYLLDKFGRKDGGDLFLRQQDELSKLTAEIKGKTKQQRNTLVKTILPRIALYRVLQTSMTKREAYSVLQDYLQNGVCVKMIKQYRMIEKLPNFFSIYHAVFSYAVLHSDNWVAECLFSNRNEFQINIRRCLWYDACVENGCPELITAFCACDDTLYSCLHKMRFFRSGSLGHGNELCDFRFTRTK